MNNEEDDGTRFLVIYRFMWSELGLSGVTLHVYARIYGFCKNGGGMFFESRNSTARFLGTTGRTVSRSIAELLSCGLIEERGERMNPNGSTTRAYSVRRDALNTTMNCTKERVGQGQKLLLAPDKATPPDRLSPPDDTSSVNVINPDGTSGSPVTGCHPIRKEERKDR